jgi:hypothetical protein
MDSHFLKFWASILTSAAHNQRMLEDTADFVKKNFFPSAELAALFHKAYGLKNQGQSRNLAQDQPEALEAFQNAFKAYLSLFQVVSRTDHEKLQEENRRLNKKVQEQEDIINQLNTLLVFKQTLSKDLQAGVLNFMTAQNEQFAELMKTMGLWSTSETETGKKQT